MYIGLQKIKDVIDYIEDNITADLDCKTLSSKMGLSVYEFRRISVGLSFISSSAARDNRLFLMYSDMGHPITKEKILLNS